MPVFVILVWLFASSGLRDLSKETRKKILSVTVSVFLTMALIFLQYRYGSRAYSHTESGVSQAELITVPSYSGSAAADGTAGTPVKHVAYIKTHKTGSSTVASIIMTYALTHNLSLAVPSSRSGNKLGWPEPFHPVYATPAKPDMLCYHSRFSQDMIDYMPKDSVFISSLRDPARQLQSAYKYFDAASCLNVTYEQFLNSTNKEVYLDGSNCKLFYNWWLRNGQIYDLGMDTIDKPTKAYVHEWIDVLDKRFSIMLILERLDESLILLRDRLNWQLDDLVYLKQNFQLTNDSHVKSEDVIIRHRAQQWNWADQLLYEHFINRHNKLIGSDPHYYQAEVQKLKRRIGLWKSRCVRKVVPWVMVTNKYLRPYEYSLGGYLLTDRAYSIDKCAHLTMTEVSKTRLVNTGHPITADVLLQGETTSYIHQ